MTRRRRLAAALTGLLLPTIGLVGLDAAPATAYWSAISEPDGRGAAAATTVNAGPTPTASVSGTSVTVSWSATTLANGTAVSGYVLRRYDATTLTEQPVQASCAGTVTATTCTETSVPDGSWRYTVTPVIGTNWQGAESGKSTAVLVDTTAPTSTLSLSSVTGGATLSGTTLIYRGSSAGSFRITNTVTDAGSGPASSATAWQGGSTTGWTHTGSTVTTPAGGPYASNLFSWTAGTTSSPSLLVTTKDARGNTRTTTLNFVNDTTAPSGTISYADGYSSGRSIAVSYSTSGDAATAQLQRSRASLKNGSCGTFGAFVNIGPVNPTSPYSDGPGTAGACYKYQLVVSDLVGNSTTATSANVAKLGYAGAVQATTGLLSYWRLGESAATASDSFTGTAGVALQDRDGETGATWTRHPGASADAVLTASGRVRKEDSSSVALYLASGVPLSASYRVEANVVAQSVVAADRACVVGRLDPTATTYYAACYEQTTGAWTLSSVVAGTATTLGSFVQSFPAGSTRRVGLDMAGSTIRVLVDGAVVITTSSGSITATGRGGLLLGPMTGTSNQSDSTGLQLDDFRIGPVDAVPAAADARGSNPGTYVNGPTLGQSGVLAGDTDTAARFDGVDDYVQVATPTGVPTGSSARSVELWFKTSGTGRQVLFGYGARATSQEFALWLNPGGTSMTAWGFGAGQDKVFALASNLADGQWHQVTLTYDATSLRLYVDGVLVGTQTATRATTIDAYGLGLGAIIVPGDTNSGGYFNGWLDEVALYTTTLSAATIADHYGLANPAQDTDGPTGGSVDGTNLVGTGGRYRNTTSLTLGLSKGTDPSGVATTGAVLQRASASLTAGTCGAFGSYATVATDPVSPLTQTLTTTTCYRYRYVVPDTLGNTRTYASPSIKVDTSAPSTPSAPTYSALSNTYGTGSTVYYRGAATSGSVTLTTTSTDAQSDIATYNFPALGGGWTTTPGASNAMTYSWAAANPTAPGAQTITATNNAGTSSSTRAVTFTTDNSTPTSGAIAYTGGRTTATTAPLTLTLGTDSGSGIATTKVIQAATAPASGGLCGTFGAFAQVATTTSTATSVVVSPAIALDTCYQFRYVVTDRVGNATTYTNPNIVRRAAVYSTTVTATTGIVDYWRLGEASGTSAADAQGANNNGTYNGAPTLGVTGALNGDTTTAVTFNGTSQYVSATRNLSTNFSIELWFRSTQANGGTGAQWYNAAALVDAAASGVTNDFGVGLASDGRVVAGVGTAGGTDSSIRSQAGLNDGTWHHVVFTRTQTGGALALYIDGVQVATGTGGTNSLTASATLCLARSATGGLFYAGTLDEVATYNTVLTAAQVTSHYNAGK
jgi:hypothetical protein